MPYEWNSTVNLIKNINTRIDECLKFDFFHQGHTYKDLLQSLYERLSTMNLEYLYYEDYLEDDDFARIYKIYRNLDFVPNELRKDFLEIY